MVVLDAKGAVIGRLAASVAKKLLLKEEVVIVNAEQAVFSGSADFIIGRYERRRTMTDKSDPEHGLKMPRRPDLFLRNIIKGMLPKRATRMKEALSRLRVYLGVPEEVKSAEQFVSKKPRLSVSLDTVCRRLGWTRW
ncbi:50S ribosomal protein L13 [Candidatus Micrarchaeota archaeon]|nr:50S ribosomal protein L13 [Candidatus Micrarchaeota archaeon]